MVFQFQWIQCIFVVFSSAFIDDNNNNNNNHDAEDLDGDDSEDDEPHWIIQLLAISLV